MDFLCGPRATELSALAERVKSKLKVVQKLNKAKISVWRGSELDEVAATIQGVLEESDLIMKKVCNDELDLVKAAFYACREKLMKFPGMDHGAPAWYNDAGSSAGYDELLKGFDTRMPDLDAKSMKAASAELLRSAEAYDASLKKYNANEIPAELESMTALRRQAATIIFTKQLFYLLGKPKEQVAEVRKVLHTELGEFREFGVKEKTILPTAMYKRAISLLTKKLAK